MSLIYVSKKELTELYNGIYGESIARAIARGSITIPENGFRLLNQIGYNLLSYLKTQYGELSSIHDFKDMLSQALINDSGSLEKLTHLLPHGYNALEESVGLYNTYGSNWKVANALILQLLKVVIYIQLDPITVLTNLTSTLEEYREVHPSIQEIQRYIPNLDSKEENSDNIDKKITFENFISIIPPHIIFMLDNYFKQSMETKQTYPYEGTVKQALRSLSELNLGTPLQFIKQKMVGKEGEARGIPLHYTLVYKVLIASSGLAEGWGEWGIGRLGLIHRGAERDWG